MKKIKEIDSLHPDYIHLDVMDGIFVENKIDFNHLTLTNPLDVHLMVQNVKKYVDIYAKMHPSYITFHLEAKKDTWSIIQYIKSKGIKAGIALNPQTPIERVKPYLKDIDMVLIMSVEPGKGGQTFIIEMKQKIEMLKKWKKDKNFTYIIEVDGGIHTDTAYLCKDADMLVVGSFITKHKNSKKALVSIREKIEKHV